MSLNSLVFAEISSQHSAAFIIIHSDVLIVDSDPDISNI